MIDDDLPTNMYYLDDSFGPAAGLREIRDDDLEEFDSEDITTPEFDDPSVISKVGGETIKILDYKGLDVVDDYFLNIPIDTNSRPSEYVSYLIDLICLTQFLSASAIQKPVYGFLTANSIFFCMMDMTGLGLGRPSKKR